MSESPHAPTVMPVLSVLLRLTELLIRNGDTQWSTALLRRAQELVDAESASERARQLRELLQLYSGMGSFSDLILQDADGAKPGNDLLDDLRQQLFARAHEAL